MQINANKKTVKILLLYKSNGLNLFRFAFL